MNIDTGEYTIYPQVFQASKKVPTKIPDLPIITIMKITRKRFLEVRFSDHAFFKVQ